MLGVRCSVIGTVVSIPSLNPFFTLHSPPDTSQQSLILVLPPCCVPLPQPTNSTLFTNNRFAHSHISRNFNNLKTPSCGKTQKLHGKQQCHSSNRPLYQVRHPLQYLPTHPVRNYPLHPPPPRPFCAQFCLSDAARFHQSTDSAAVCRLRYLHALEPADAMDSPKLTVCLL